MSKIQSFKIESPIFKRIDHSCKLHPQLPSKLIPPFYIWLQTTSKGCFRSWLRGLRTWQLRGNYGLLLAYLVSKCSTHDVLVHLGTMLTPLLHWIWTLNLAILTSLLDLVLYVAFGVASSLFDVVASLKFVCIESSIRINARVSHMLIPRRSSHLIPLQNVCSCFWFFVTLTNWVGFQTYACLL